jgi:hypothetical protein
MVGGHQPLDGILVLPLERLIERRGGLVDLFDHFGVAGPSRSNAQYEKAHEGNKSG